MQRNSTRTILNRIGTGKYNFREEIHNTGLNTTDFS